MEIILRGDIMLEIKNICCKVKSNDKEVLKDFSLAIHDGEVHAIMGPNGVGKSTLSKIIMNHYNYEIIKGDILFNGESIINKKTDEIAKRGIFLAMQEPTVISGVSNSEFLKEALQSKDEEKIDLYTFIKDLNKKMQELELNTNMLHRSVNLGFSGGEKKKNEVLQLKVLKPKLIILDELDSGLDVDSLKICCNNINDYLSQHKDCSVLIITHYPRILEYIKPNYVHILNNGNIIKTGDLTLAQQIEKNGYLSINEIRKNEENE